MRNLLVIILLGFSSVVWADNFMPSNNNRLPPKRDPFTTSNKMHIQMQQQAGLKNGGVNGFLPGYGTANLPKMRLKGFVTKTKNKATAILDIEGAGVYMVSKGDQIGLHAIGQNTVLEIMEVSSHGVKVRSGQINQVIVVR